VNISRDDIRTLYYRIFFIFLLQLLYNCSLLYVNDHCLSMGGVRMSYMLLYVAVYMGGHV
jgi:hypothetical protein